MLQSDFDDPADDKYVLFNEGKPVKKRERNFAAMSEDAKQENKKVERDEDIDDDGNWVIGGFNRPKRKKGQKDFSHITLHIKNSPEALVALSKEERKYLSKLVAVERGISEGNRRRAVIAFRRATGWYDARRTGNWAQWYWNVNLYMINKNMQHSRYNVY